MGEHSVPSRSLRWCCKDTETGEHPEKFVATALCKTVLGDPCSIAFEYRPTLVVKSDVGHKFLDVMNVVAKLFRANLHISTDIVNVESVTELRLVFMNKRSAEIALLLFVKKWTTLAPHVRQKCPKWFVKERLQYKATWLEGCSDITRLASRDFSHDRPWMTATTPPVENHGIFSRLSERHYVGVPRVLTGDDVPSGAAQCYHFRTQDWEQ
jgi:hypothetical protein